MMGYPSRLRDARLQSLTVLSFCSVLAFFLCICLFPSSCHIHRFTEPHGDRSLELAADYDKAKDAQDRATANSTENFHNKREIAKEFKAYKEHKTEASKLTRLKRERVS